MTAVLCTRLSAGCERDRMQSRRRRVLRARVQVSRVGREGVVDWVGAGGRGDNGRVAAVLPRLSHVWRDGSRRLGDLAQTGERALGALGERRRGGGGERGGRCPRVRVYVDRVRGVREASVFVHAQRPSW